MLGANLPPQALSLDRANGFFSPRSRRRFDAPVYHDASQIDCGNSVEIRHGVTSVGLTHWNNLQKPFCFARSPPASSLPPGDPSVFGNHRALTTTDSSPDPQPSDSCPESEPSQTYPSLVDRSIVLTGPTASGKSSVAVRLAERIGGEILSLDSIAVYRAMDIGTAKPSPEDRQRVPHHLIDLVDANDDFSVACYLRQAHRIVDEIIDRGHRAIFVGGTPMFLKAVLRGFDPGPPPDWKFRESVEADLETHGVEALQKRLAQVDPLAAHRIDPGDTRRMIRALEVVKLTGVPMSHHQSQFDQSHSASECHVYAFRWPRHQLHDRINRRVEQMFSDGLIDEIRGLINRFGSLSRTASQAVGYREIIRLMEEQTELSPEVTMTVKEEVAAHTRQLARRQETWFRSFREVTPIEVEEPLDVETVTDQLVASIESRPNESRPDESRPDESRPDESRPDESRP